MKKYIKSNPDKGYFDITDDNQIIDNYDPRVKMTLKRFSDKLAYHKWVSSVDIDLVNDVIYVDLAESAISAINSGEKDVSYFESIITALAKYIGLSLSEMEYDEGNIFIPFQ